MRKQTQANTDTKGNTMPLHTDILAALQAIDTVRGPEPDRNWFAYHGPERKTVFVNWKPRADAAQGWFPTPQLGTKMQRSRAVKKLEAEGLVEIKGNGSGRRLRLTPTGTEATA